MPIYSWSKTASNNGAADGTINWAEGMAPSAVNDSARNEMAAVKKWVDDVSGTLTTAGTATAYTLTTNSVFDTAANMSGAKITFIPHADSGAAPTMAVDGLTARALNYSTGVAVPTGYFKTGTPYTVTYIHATTEFIVHDAANVINPSLIPIGTGLVVSGGSLTAPANLPRGYIDGCIISNGTDATNDIDVAAGVCRDSTNTVGITVAAMAGKQLDANWVPGANAGMRNSAAGIANGTYHIYAVAKADGTQDIYAHTSTTVATVITALQAEAGGSAYLYARRIGSIIRAGGAILAFVQRGDNFHLVTPVQEFSDDNPGTSAVTRTLTAVPTGIVVEASMVAGVVATSSGNMAAYFSSLDMTDSAVDAGVFVTVISPNTTPYTGAAPVQIFTNTSGQIRTRCSASGASDFVRGITLGWNDLRGKDS